MLVALDQDKRSAVMVDVEILIEELGESADSLGALTTATKVRHACSPEN